MRTREEERKENRREKREKRKVKREKKKENRTKRKRRWMFTVARSMEDYEFQSTTTRNTSPTTRTIDTNACTRTLGQNGPLKTSISRRSRGSRSPFFLTILTCLATSLHTTSSGYLCHSTMSPLLNVAESSALCCVYLFASFRSSTSGCVSEGAFPKHSKQWYYICGYFLCVWVNNRIIF